MIRALSRDHLHDQEHDQYDAGSGPEPGHRDRGRAARSGRPAPRWQRDQELLRKNSQTEPIDAWPLMTAE